MAIHWYSTALRGAALVPLALAVSLGVGAAQAQEKKVVPFLTAESSPEAVEQLNKIIDQFESENPEIDVELQLMSNDDRMSRAINAVAVGEELGIFEIERRLVPDFTRAGFLLQLDSIVEEIGLENFIPGSLLYWPWDGHLYQLTADLSGSQIYWRKDLFEQAGLAEPDSY
jgi:multiple sugar transport system substrate-binding protein